MRTELMEILACPLCKRELSLDIIDAKERDIIKGTLHCKICDANYPIEEGIPNLLPSGYIVKYPEIFVDKNKS